MKILVLSTYRTGATNFCKQLAEEHGLTNHNECFDEKTHPLERTKTLKYLTESDNWVVKMLPKHDQCGDRDGVKPNPLLTLIDSADKVYCVMRRDLNEQLRSVWLAKISTQITDNLGVELPDWHTDFEKPIDLNTFDGIPYTYIHKGDVKTIKYPWCEVVSKSLPLYRWWLFKDIKWVADVCNNHSQIEIVYTEDMDHDKKYHRPFVFPKCFPTICTGTRLEELTVAQ